MERQIYSVQNVKDLQANGKQWLESVLGCGLSENQQVLIVVSSPGVAPSAEIRRRAFLTWERITQSVADNLQRHGVSAEEYDTAVDEAMDSVRPRRN